MEELKIGGYTITELKKVQAAVKKDASKIIADAISAGETAVKEIINIGQSFEDEEDVVVDEETKSKLESLAKEAHKQLELAKLVSNISDVSYYLPFREDGYGDSYYNDLENCYTPIESSSVDSLMGLLEDMEYTSQQWHSSTC